MLLFQIRSYEGHVSHECQIRDPAHLDEVLGQMRAVAKDWKASGGSLDACRILNLAMPEDDEDPDHVVAFVDENKRNPIVVVGKRLEEARAMLIPN
jgi:hypothetical protein